MTYRMAGSPLPLLDIARVIRAGVLKRNRSAVIDEANRIGFFLDDEEDDRLIIQIDRQLASLVLLSRSKQGAFHHWYFVCPSCEENCSYIVYCQRWICTSCFIDSPNGFSKPHKRALVYEAKHLVPYHPRSSRAQDDVFRPSDEKIHRAAETSDAILGNQADERKDRPETAEADVVIPYGDPSWTAAMAYGNTVDDAPAVRHVIAQPNEWWDWNHDIAYSRPQTIAVSISVPALDLRGIIKNLMPKPGRFTAYAPGWPPELTGGHPVILLMDCRDAVPRVAVARRGDDPLNPQWQAIRLERTPQKRLRLVCPVTAKRCDLLYWRDGLFASFAAQRLVSASQRSVGKRRARKST